MLHYCRNTFIEWVVLQEEKGLKEGLFFSSFLKSLASFAT
jgi:hypothetical protein